MYHFVIIRIYYIIKNTFFQKYGFVPSCKTYVFLGSRNFLFLFLSLKYEDALPPSLHCISLSL